MPVTLRVRGAGGAEFDADLPALEPARSRFLAKIESGELVALDRDNDPIDRIGLLEELTADDGEPDAPGDHLDGMTVKQLRAYAAGHEPVIDLGDARTKAQLVAAIRDAEAFTPDA